MEKSTFNGAALEAAISRLSTNEEKAEAYKAAALEADEAQDNYFRLYFRNELVEQISFIDPVRTLPYISEFVQIFSEHPDAMGEEGVGLLFENLVYGIEQIGDIPEVPREQWFDLIEEVHSAAQRFGRGWQCYWYVMSLYYEKVDLQRAVECAREMLTCPHDVNYPYSGYANAIAARIFLAAGERSAADEQAGVCEEIGGDLAKGKCYEAYVEYLLNQGRLDEADAISDKLYDIIEYSGCVLRDWSYIDLEAATKMLVEQREFLNGRQDNGMEYSYAKGAWATCRQLAKHHDQVVLSFDESFPLYNVDGIYDPTELANHFHSQATDLGERFDKRDGGNWYAQDIALACVCESLPQAEEEAASADIKTKQGGFFSRIFG